MKDPRRFGEHGGSNRAFGLQDTALSTGLTIGPLISGSLTDAAGYYWSSCALGECFHFKHSLYVGSC